MPMMIMMKSNSCSLKIIKPDLIAKEALDINVLPLETVGSSRNEHSKWLQEFAHKFCCQTSRQKFGVNVTVRLGTQVQKEWAKTNKKI